MKVKIAMYRKNGSDFEYPQRHDLYEDNTDFIRLTNVVEADFIEVPKEEINTKEIAIIRQAITNEMAASESRLNKLKQTLQERLAIGSDE